MIEVVEGRRLAAAPTRSVFCGGLPNLSLLLSCISRHQIRPGRVAQGDEFCETLNRDIASDANNWEKRDYSRIVVGSSYRFDNLKEVARLFKLYWSCNRTSDLGEPKLVFGYNIVVYEKQA